MEFVRRFRRFFREDLWHMRASDQPVPRRQAVKALKIVIHTGRGFVEKRTGERASALTLYTLLAIVPVLALLFGIAKGFGMEHLLESFLYEQFSDHRELMDRVVGFARGLLDKTQGGWIALGGVAFILYTAVKVLGHIEAAFNAVWSVSKSRSLSRKFSDYLSLILVGPFLLIGASGLNVYLATLVNRATQAVPLSEVVGPVARFFIGFSPVALLWVLFSFLYIFLPHTKVRIGSGILGGAVTAILYQTIQTLYIALQIGVSKNNAIYGSFAALPLFIIWLQISWHIVLIGAELTHQHQVFDDGESEESFPERFSFRTVKRLGLAITRQVTQHFLHDQPPPTAEAIAADLSLPVPVAKVMLSRLLQAGVLAETGTEPDQPAGYLPAHDPHLLTGRAVVEALEGLGEDLPDISMPEPETGSAALAEEESPLAAGTPAPGQPGPPAGPVPPPEPGRRARAFLRGLLPRGNRTFPGAGKRP